MKETLSILFSLVSRIALVHSEVIISVFPGIVEVRVSQIILGEKVEVTVCELTKGDYFGERSLLSNENRAGKSRCAFTCMIHAQTYLYFLSYCCY
jgi:CRP-like cAMP-binding protein